MRRAPSSGGSTRTIASSTEPGAAPDRGRDGGFWDFKLTRRGLATTNRRDSYRSGQASSPQLGASSRLRPPCLHLRTPFRRVGRPFQRAGGKNAKCEMRNEELNWAFGAATCGG